MYIVSLLFIGEIWGIILQIKGRQNYELTFCCYLYIHNKKHLLLHWDIVCPKPVSNPGPVAQLCTGALPI